MLSHILSKLWMETTPRPLLGRWCHVAYSASCDPIRKAELNTNDHGVVLFHSNPRVIPDAESVYRCEAMPERSGEMDTQK